MTWISFSARPHNCPTPPAHPDSTPLLSGDLWQCDICGQAWIRNDTIWKAITFRRLARIKARQLKAAGIK